MADSIVIYCQLEDALTSVKQTELAEVLDIGTTQIHRIMKNENGIKLQEFAKLLSHVGAQIVGKDQIIVDREEYEAMCLLLRKRL